MARRFFLSGPRGKSTRRVLGLTGAAVALAVAGCGSSDTSTRSDTSTQSAGTTGSGGGTDTSASSQVPPEVQAAVKAAMAPQEWQAPGPAFDA
jgi:hypothetical protein